MGDQLRFGESSRTYVLCGPADLMPDEGPSREDRMKQAALKVGRRWTCCLRSCSASFSAVKSCCLVWSRTPIKTLPLESVPVACPWGQQSVVWAHRLGFGSSEWAVFCMAPRL